MLKKAGVQRDGSECCTDREGPGQARKNGTVSERSRSEPTDVCYT